MAKFKLEIDSLVLQQGPDLRYMIERLKTKDAEVVIKNVGFCRDPIYIIDSLPELQPSQDIK